MDESTAKSNEATNQASGSQAEFHSFDLPGLDESKRHMEFMNDPLLGNAFDLFNTTEWTVDSLHSMASVPPFSAGDLWWENQPQPDLWVARP
jgi:hypothetical protein